MTPLKEDAARSYLPSGFAEYESLWILARRTATRLAWADADAARRRINAVAARRALFILEMGLKPASSRQIVERLVALWAVTPGAEGGKRAAIAEAAAFLANYPADIALDAISARAGRWPGIDDLRMAVEWRTAARRRKLQILRCVCANPQVRS